MTRPPPLSFVLLLHIICIFPVFSDPDLTLLQYNAIARIPDYFSQDDEFIFLGEIFVEKENVIFVFNKHIWGEARRMTGRILLFNNDGILIGIYGVINQQPIVFGKKLIFPVIEEYGNVIDFTYGIPETVKIDGEIINYKNY
jgi:hypothetical protein